MLLKFIQTVPTREVLKHFMSLMLQHRLFLANLSELLSVLSVLEPTRYEQISAMTDSDLKI